MPGHHCYDTDATPLLYVTSRNTMRVRIPIRKLPRMISIWSRYLFNRFLRGLQVTGPPTFIVGCGHSGTSLLLRILGAHSRMFGLPFESMLAFRRRPERMLKAFERPTIAERKVRWVEKTPRHITRIDRLMELCPDAKFLLILRDGRDVACSIQDREGDIELGIKRWVHDNRAGQQYWDHPNVHVLKYERIVEDVEGTITAALHFLGEEYEPEMREYHRSPKSIYHRKLAKPESPSGKNHEQYRNWQINQPLFDGRGKWMRMTAVEKRIVKEHANDMLIEYGYVTDDKW
jgi:hypothetical protein